MGICSAVFHSRYPRIVVSKMYTGVDGAGLNYWVWLAFTIYGKRENVIVERETFINFRRFIADQRYMRKRTTSSGFDYQFQVTSIEVGKKVKIPEELGQRQSQELE